MNYSAYLQDSKIRNGKSGAYRTYLVKNIEVIGKRKLVVIGGDEDISVLNDTINGLREKSVDIPEVAFRVTTEQNKANEDGSVRFIEELKGQAGTYYVLILAPYYISEIQLAAMDKVIGTSASIAIALKTQCGYTERDYCEMNKPTGFGFNMANNKITGAIAADAKHYSALEAATVQQLFAYKGKMNGQRCFILGNTGAKLDQLNVIMNERTFACDNFCDFFSRTPQRPTYYLLTDPKAYLENGKYIEGMECFINADVNVSEEKFKKKPTYLNILGNGLIDGLPTFQSVGSIYETSQLMAMYQMLQLALYMGFSEIYIYGFDGVFPLEIDADGVGRVLPDGDTADFPEKARQLLDSVCAYAEENGIKIFNMCDSTGLSMFDEIKYEDIDFTSSSAFGKF